MPTASQAEALTALLDAQLAGAPLNAVFREALPFTLALIVVLLLVTCVPLLSLWLPGG
jgi:TRAP-type C4-dicarboxylate transport system permease large subunit